LLVGRVTEGVSEAEQSSCTACAKSAALIASWLPGRIACLAVA
jgi:hypothetical protein